MKNTDVKTKKMGIGGHLAALLIGGGIFALFFFLLKIGMIWCIILGVVGYLFTVGQLFSRKIRQGGTQRLSGADGKKLNAVLQEGKEKLGEMRGYISKIRDYQIRKKANAVYQAATAIFDNFKDDPRDIKGARPFLNYYFDSAIEIIKKYIELKDKKIQTPEMAETLSKVEATLETIKAAFEEQLVKLQENDVMDLDVEIEVLKKSLQGDGLGKG